MRKGHVPIRTCIGCGKRRPKSELLRLVLKENSLTMGCAEGRGMYLCRNGSCADKAQTGRNTKRLLGRALTDLEVARLRHEMLAENDLDGGCGEDVICCNRTGGGPDA